MQSKNNPPSFETIEPITRLPVSEVKILKGLAKEFFVRKNQIALKEGDSSRDLYLVGSGELKVFHRSPAGKEFTIASVRSGEFLGEVAFLSGGARSASVEASEDSWLFHFPYEALSSAMGDLPHFIRTIAETLASRLGALNIKVSHLVFLDVFARLVRVLDELPNIKEGKSRKVEPRPTHDELASLIGTSRELVTRALKVLQLEGNVSVDGKALLIHSLPTYD